MDTKLYNSRFSRQQVIGFIVSVVVQGVFTFLRYRYFLLTELSYLEILMYGIGFILFIVVIILSTSKKYKLFAQGAMIGWVVYFVVAMAVIFVVRQVM